jgi:MoaA/NifB/PqqE/SkfB family radical SAM enzyme
MARWAHKLGVLRGLLSGETAYGGPDYVNIDLTHRCNLQCFYCRWHSPLIQRRRLEPARRTDLSGDIFRELCGDLRVMGTRTVQFVGAGEPLLHPNIFEMIRIAKDNRLGVLMYTNGTLLQEERARSLIGSGLDVLRVSLGATSSEEYAKKHPRATADEFDRLLSGLRLLSRLKTEAATTRPIVELTHAITREGAGSIAAVPKLARATGCERLLFSVLLDFGEAGIRRFTLRDHEQERVRENLRHAGRRLAAIGIDSNVEQVLLRYRIGARVWDQFPCYTAWYGSFVGTDGSVHVCQRSEVPLGTLSKNRFGEIWNNPEYRAFRRRSLSDADPASWLRHTDCSFCPHAVNNHKVHQVFRWIAPVRRALAKRAPKE